MDLTNRHDLERLAFLCPCGVDCHALVVKQYRPIGDGKYETYYAPDYHHYETMTWFCSAACSLKWNELFWVGFKEHESNATRHR